MDFENKISNVSINLFIFFVSINQLVVDQKAIIGGWKLCLKTKDDEWKVIKNLCESRLNNHGKYCSANFINHYKHRNKHC